MSFSLLLGSAVGKLISFGAGGMDYSGCDSHLDQLHWASRWLCLHLATDDTCNEMSMAVLLVDSGDGLL